MLCYVVVLFTNNIILSKDFFLFLFFELVASYKIKRMLIIVNIYINHDKTIS
jgi:hypothetical protein